MKKTFFLLPAFLICFLLLPMTSVKAQELSPAITLSNGGEISDMTDGDYNTAVLFSANDTIKVTASDGSKMKAVYIKWDSPVAPYFLDTDESTVPCGINGFIHEYICFESETGSFTIHIPEDGMRICDMRIFSDDTVPSDVQIWDPPCERADIMLIPAHSDDEILFFGGIIPTYGAERGAAIQVVYMTEFWSTWPIREHEKLDGLWSEGLRTYPVCGNFKDMYSLSLSDAQSLYDEEEMTAYLVDVFRHFRPQVVVTHDFNGEYGHGSHQLTARCVSIALDRAADENYWSDSPLYDTSECWDVPKAYFHLYAEHHIKLDLNIPLASMNGMTALEVAAEAYKQHVSQQDYWFYVSDSYEYSCADFGLYRTNVGYDTSNDLLENLELYTLHENEIPEQQEETPEPEGSEIKTETRFSDKAKTICITIIILLVLLFAGTVLLFSWKKPKE